MNERKSSKSKRLQPLSMDGVDLKDALCAAMKIPVPPPAPRKKKKAPAKRKPKA